MPQCEKRLCTLATKSLAKQSFSENYSAFYKLCIEFRRFEAQVITWLLSTAIHLPMDQHFVDETRPKVLADVMMYPIRR